MNEVQKERMAMPTKECFKVAVCENVPELRPQSTDWNWLCLAVRAHAPDLVLLNELPFGPWVAAGKTFDRDRWAQSVDLHCDGLQALEELGAAAVAGTRPATCETKRVNEAFTWTRQNGYRAAHCKQYFPDEEGYYEAQWFQAGDGHFKIADLGGLRCGFLICTEVMFNEHARAYGRNGAHLILVPRAVGSVTLERWLVALRMAAIVSGCYVLSSNRAGSDSQGQVFGGAGWIISPHGDVLAETSAQAPLVCHDIDLGEIREAQRQYPCYVAEMSKATFRSNCG